MRTLLPDPAPAPFEELLAQRRRWGADRHDEVWEGVLHMAPAPNLALGQLVAQLIALLLGPAKAAGLKVSDQFNLGDGPEDYRVPDVGLHRAPGNETWIATAALAAEVLSAGDETWEKLPFYAAHRVEELVIIDPEKRTVQWRALEHGEYPQVKRSRLIDLGPEQLAAQLDWPA